MIDYLSLSLAVIFCLVMWWSFLALSGLEESWPIGWQLIPSAKKLRHPCNWI